MTAFVSKHFCAAKYIVAIQFSFFFNVLFFFRYAVNPAVSSHLPAVLLAAVPGRVMVLVQMDVQRPDTQCGETTLYTSSLATSRSLVLHTRCTNQ